MVFDTAISQYLLLKKDEEVSPMKKWQKFWLYMVILFSITHIIRDIFQDLGIDNFLSTVLASLGPPKVAFPLYWTIFNTYLIAGVEIMLSLICFKKNYFGKLGISTIIIAVSSLLLWSFYYFYL